jgi:TetR/AcrR family transcriptional regulator, tetracycline repressor protein
VGRARTRGQRAGLSHQGVLAAARDLLASGGPDALTMRALAERLGVAPNALYSHVDSKTALIDEILDDLLAEIEAPALDRPDPAAALHALMAATHRVLLAHPHLVPLYLARQGARGPHAQRLGELMLTWLEQYGLTGSQAVEARRVLIVYTLGFAAFATRPLFQADTQPQLSAVYLVATFDTGLGWLLDGISSRCEGSAPETVPDPS